MYGAFIGDIVGSKYEFQPMKTKAFPLFSDGCNYTDDSIMTAAVAKAIMLSQEQNIQDDQQKHKSFQVILVEVMQDFGRRYPHPMGGYGGRFGTWLRESEPKPYHSFGNGSAMRVSPCGLAAVTMNEALILACASARVTHDHPEGIKGAMAVAAAIFLAKTGKTKEEIRTEINKRYYSLDFTLDAIRDTYHFNETCQGTVPQAIVAFLESESFEDAIRNAVSLGGDSDTLAAITGSIAWAYDAAQNHGDEDAAMRQLKEKVVAHLPAELIDIAENFRKMCIQRAGTFHRVGSCTPIITDAEAETFTVKKGVVSSKNTFASKKRFAEIINAMTMLCNKYIVLMELLYKDKELNQWCRNYSAYAPTETHHELEKMIYDNFMKEVYHMNFMPEVLSWALHTDYTFERAIAGKKADFLYGFCLEIRGDHFSNGSLICDAIANGKLYRFMKAWLDAVSKPIATTNKAQLSKQYTLDYVKVQPTQLTEKTPGSRKAWFHQDIHSWCLNILLDKEQLWYLSVYINQDGSISHYSLDFEAANDSHYHFTEEAKLRKALYEPGDEQKYFDEILLRYVQAKGGFALLDLIMPYVTEQFHYD